MLSELKLREFAVVPLEMTPPTVKLQKKLPPPAWVIVRVVPAAVPRSTAPLPMLLYTWLPLTVKSPLIVMGLLLAIVRGLALKLSVPPLMVNVPAAAPSAVSLPRVSVPALKMTPPLKVLLPESSWVPAPDFVRA